jgi:asparagine synthase (glutamine-hydrolysing)
MCGIVGFLTARGRVDARTIAAMADQIRYRGPDSSGVWTDEKSGLAFGHRRLSIVDLSEAGHQPMLSIDGRYVLTYNGEIYNHLDLRNELLAAGWSSPWRGHSDTETLLAAIQHWGIKPALQKLNGMFAVGLWDRKDEVLTLARDRAGEKPLYYGQSGQAFLFTSELRALKSFPGWHGEIDAPVVNLYFRYGYVPDPYCIFKGFAKLPPAHFLQVKHGQVSEPERYWDLRQVVLQPRLSKSPDAFAEELLPRLQRAVKIRMASDVPLGAFLSGGIDSSTVVSLMQQASSQPIRTFTIGFDVAGYNEAEAAKAVAKHLGTDHTELYVSPQETLATVPSIPGLWDEPFGDSSQIPTYLLSKLTRQSVTVALSGDGGDEIFSGYNRYGQGYDAYKKLRGLPSGARRLAACGLQSLPLTTIEALSQNLPMRMRLPAMGDRVSKLAKVLKLDSDQDYYRMLVSQTQDPAQLLNNAHEPTSLPTSPETWPKLTDFREAMMYLDTMSYLPGDILTKVDRATMATSLEARVPFLDHELIEFAWSIPLDVKLNMGKTKWLLRNILGRHVPQALFERPKVGFGIPIEHWLKGPLRAWAEDLLDANTLKNQGYLRSETVRTLWDDYLAGRARNHHQLWNILMFQGWLRDSVLKARL